MSSFSIVRSTIPIHTKKMNWRTSSIWSHFRIASHNKTAIMTINEIVNQSSIALFDRCFW